METGLIILLLISPFIGFLINLSIGNKLPKSLSGCIASSMVLLSFVSSLCLFISSFHSDAPFRLYLFDWLSLEHLNIELSFVIDRLALLWLLFVTGIGFLIHVYSMSYMKEDPRKFLYFAYLNLFIFFMLILVTGANLVVMFVGWEGVGLCSYLLIGFWSRDHSNNDAAKKAFVMNRIGDLGFLIGIIILAIQFHTLDFASLSDVLKAENASNPYLAIAALSLFIGAMGKSAQIPLYTWLPDAMAGPTPVSALIHAATMVTAGIYMLVKLNFLFILTPDVLMFIAVIGGLTALFAATIGLMQNDIKKVLAYSTVSQLGLMFMAVGVGAFHVAIFHVITHAFFKACLFLGAGSVIHALGGEQDMRKMGGLRSKMKITYLTFLISTCSIAGIPFTAGFFSKDEIMISLFESNPLLWIIGVSASLMTAYYMFRVLFLTFNNSFRGTQEQASHLHESSKIITIPLMILAFFAIAAGYIGLPAGFSWLNHYLTPVMPQLAYLDHTFGLGSIVLMCISIIIALIGFFLAYKEYIINKGLPLNDSEYQGLSKIIYNKFYIDDVYDKVFVKPTYLLGDILKEIVDRIIKYLVNFGGTLAVWLSNPFSRLQNGSIGLYLFFFVLGFTGIVTFMFFII